MCSRLITDKVDSIVSPEIVFPVSLKESDYFLQNIVMRSMSTFHHIPFPFIFREGWDSGSVNLYETYENTLRYSASAQEYVQSTRTQREDLFTSIFECIEQVELVDDEIPDSGIIQSAILRSR